MTIQGAVYRLDQHRIRSGILASTLIGIMVIAFGVPAAQAAVNCVVGPGVTQPLRP